MKLRFEQINAALQRSLTPVYAITGDEIVLVEEVLAQIQLQAKNQGFDEIHQVTTDQYFDWSAWLTNTQNNGLFSARQIHLLRIHNGKPGDKGSAALQSYCRQLNPDALLIVVCPKLESSSLKTKWWLALDNAGTTMQIWPLDPLAQRAWLLSRLKQVPLNIEPAAADWLLQQTTGNLLAIRQYIEQFKLLFAAGATIKLADLQECVSDQSEFDLFKLVDACNLGDKNNCLRIVQKLQATGTEAILIIWALARELRQLYQMHEKLQSGATLDFILREQRIPPMRTRAIEQAIKRVKKTQIETLLAQAAMLDAAMKGMNSLPLWPSLQRWCLAYCGVEQ